MNNVWYENSARNCTAWGKWFFLNNWLDYKSCTVFILFLRLLQQICFRSKNNRRVSKQFNR